MDRDKMREDLTNIIDSNRRGIWENDPSEEAEYILSLLAPVLEKATGTCIWTGNDYKGYIKGCNNEYIFRKKPNYCEDCGRRIEVKDGQE